MNGRAPSSPGSREPSPSVPSVSAASGFDPSRIDAQELEDFLSDAIGDSIDMDWTGRIGAQAVIREMEREGLHVTRVGPETVVPNWWNPDADDPFWMLETPEGEWLKNRHTGSVTRDPVKAMRFPSEQHADMVRRSLHHPLWMSLTPTEHLWIGLSNASGMSNQVTPAFDRARLFSELERISDDFHPDRDADAPLALQEMREALYGLMAQARGEA